MIGGELRVQQLVARALLSRTRKALGRENRAFLRRCVNNEKPLNPRQHRRFAKLARLVGVEWEPHQ